MNTSTNLDPMQVDDENFDRAGQLARFGLHDGQFGRDRIGHNNGWYTSDGIKLGFGDLAHDDVAQIEAVLQDGEMFVALAESDSHWDYHSNEFGGISSQNPGRRYIAEHCRFIITNNGSYLASDFNRSSATYELDGITFTAITRAQARTLLGV